jgi:hypothetical protein
VQKKEAIVFKTIWDGFVSRWNINPTAWGRTRMTARTLLFVAALPFILVLCYLIPEKMSSWGYRMHLSAHAGSHYLDKVDELQVEFDRLEGEVKDIVQRLPPTPTKEGMELITQIFDIQSQQAEIRAEMKALLDRSRAA